MSMTYTAEMQGQTLLASITRGNAHLTLEQIDGVGITSYILTQSREESTSEKKYVRRTLRKSFFRKVILVVPVQHVKTDRKLVFCEVYTNLSHSYREFEKAAARMR